VSPAHKYVPAAVEWSSLLRSDIHVPSDWTTMID
jgi:hypothetical protein